MDEYMQCAAKLAEDYPALVKEHKQLSKRLEGSWTYTKEMAIADLDRVTVSYDKAHVKSGGVSNPSERIALAMTDEYMQMKQEEYDRERDRCLREREYIEWKMRTVETAFRERMNESQRNIFRMIYVQGMTFREVRASLTRKTCNRDIAETKKKIWLQISKELQTQRLSNPWYVKRVMTEANGEPRKGRVMHEDHR